MINNKTVPNSCEELTVVIDPGAYTHMVTYDGMKQLCNQQPLGDCFSQLYFEDPKNKCILIRGCKDEYKKDNCGKIELIDKGEYGLSGHLHGKYSYEEIRKIITEQANVLGINLQNIKKINIFDVSHTDKETKHFSTGSIDEKVNALKALNELCPNCEHTKIASTACWGGRKSPTGKDLITEVQKSIDSNNNWHKNNIVEIDITPKDDNNTQIRLGQDSKPHVSYCLDKAIYKKDQRPLPPTFTRHIHLLAKGKQEVVVPQTHTFQNDQYRVTEGEGSFPELSTQDIKQTMQLKNIQTGNCHYGQLNYKRKKEGFLKFI